MRLCVKGKNYFDRRLGHFYAAVVRGNLAKAFELTSVQVFRRAESPYESAHLKLSGLEPEARYAVTDLDRGASQELSGRELLEKGLQVTIPNRPSAVVFTYKKMR